MEDQKLENLLNLALSATEEERLKSSILNVGYSAEEKEWDLIVKYTGNLKQYENDRIKVVELYNEYAIITVPENLLEMVTTWPGVEYIETEKIIFSDSTRKKGFLHIFSPDSAFEVDGQRHPRGCH